MQNKTDIIMKKRVPTLEWRERLDQITPAEYRIGNNLLYIERARIPDMAYEPWKTDVNTAIIYTCRNIYKHATLHRIGTNHGCHVGRTNNATTQHKR